MSHFNIMLVSDDYIPEEEGQYTELYKLHKNGQINKLTCYQILDYYTNKSFENEITINEIKKLPLYMISLIFKPAHYPHCFIFLNIKNVKTLEYIYEYFDKLDKTIIHNFLHSYILYFYEKSLNYNENKCMLSIINIAEQKSIDISYSLFIGNIIMGDYLYFMNNYKKFTLRLNKIEPSHLNKHFDERIVRKINQYHTFTKDEVKWVAEYGLLEFYNLLKVLNYKVPEYAPYKYAPYKNTHYKVNTKTHEANLNNYVDYENLCEKCGMINNLCCHKGCEMTNIQIMDELNKIGHLTCVGCFNGEENIKCSNKSVKWCHNINCNGFIKKNIIGQNYKKVCHYLETNNIRYRIREINEKNFITFCDYIKNRKNLIVNNDIVTHVTFG